MTIETGIAFAAVVVAFIALFFTGLAAKAALDQTAIQRQLRREAAEPYVWADVRADPHTGTLLNFVIGNSGRTVATNVRVKVFPPLSAVGPRADVMKRLQARLESGFDSLAPGRVLPWSLGPAPDLIDEDGEHAHTVTIDADGPFGPIPTLKYVIDMDDWREHVDRPDGSLHLVRKAVEEMAGRFPRYGQPIPVRVVADEA
jgi:hypothetical protein